MSNSIIFCKTCKNKFQKRFLLQNDLNEYYCKECFKRAFLASSLNRLNLNEDDEDDSNKMFTKSEIKEFQRIDQVQCMSLSKQPVECPHNNCNKSVSVLELSSHFHYDHSQVPIIFTQFNEESLLALYVNEMSLGITRCLVVFKINEKPEQQQNVLPNPTILLLAALLPENGAISNESTDDNENVNSQKNKLNIWLSANFCTMCTCTLMVVAAGSNRHIKYEGAVLPMPFQLTDGTDLDGYCLSLSHYHVNGMSENGQKQLYLNINIHCNESNK